MSETGRAQYKLSAATSSLPQLNRYAQRRGEKMETLYSVQHITTAGNIVVDALCTTKEVAEARLAEIRARFAGKTWYQANETIEKTSRTAMQEVISEQYTCGHGVAELTGESNCYTCSPAAQEEAEAQQAFENKAWTKLMN